jgi:hypothetical protein
LAQLLQASTGERQKERGILAVGAYAYESKGEGGGDGGGTQTKHHSQKKERKKNTSLKERYIIITTNKTTSSTPSSLPSPTTQGTSWEETSLVGIWGRDLRERNLVEGARKGNLKEGNGLGH